MNPIPSREGVWSRARLRPGRACWAVLIGGLVVTGPTLGAQPPVEAPEADSGSESIVLRDGYPVQVVVNQTLASGWRKLHVGQVIKAHVGNDIEVGSEVVIEEGALVELRIGHVRKGQLFHGRGQLLLEVVSTRSIDRKRVVLRGGLFVEGRKHVVLDYIPTSFTSIADLAAGLVGSAVIAPGGNARIGKGTTFEVSVDGDHSFEGP